MKNEYRYGWEPKPDNSFGLDQWLFWGMLALIAFIVIRFG